jgi:hypothetical protein
MVHVLLSFALVRLGSGQDLFLPKAAVASPASENAKFGGISKNTWASYEPRECAQWFIKYIPGVEYEGNECADNVCPCAIEGRLHMKNATGREDTFGVHAVNCTYHPAGGCSILDIEEGWQAKFGNFSQYHPLMDHNLGLWANNLSMTLDKFDEDGVKYYPMVWTYEHKVYYSAIANPCGYALIEFISDEIGGRSPSDFNADGHSRMQFIDWNGPHGPTEENPLGLYPLKMSRPTTKLDEVAAFYDDVFHTVVLHNETFDDGSRLVTLKFPPTSFGSTMPHLQLWHRPEEPAKSDSCSEWTVAKWEAYQLATHDAEMQGPSCGMDRWLDNHFAFDCSDDQYDVKDYVAGFEQQGIKYRVDPMTSCAGCAENPLWYIYSYDPSGYGVELHFATWTDHPEGLVEANPPSCIHGAFANGTCAGQEAGQCT